jgi:hypothetical protein
MLLRCGAHKKAVEFLKVFKCARLANSFVIGTASNKHTHITVRANPQDSLASDPGAAAAAVINTHTHSS